LSDEVRRVTVQVRPPKGTFPGEVAIGHYCVVEGSVVLTDEEGKPVSGISKRSIAGGDAHLIACRMIRDRRGRPTGFNRTLNYPKVVY
jgi:hypothetical protein